MILKGKNVLAVPPGETIREQLETRGMSQKDFASRMGLSEKHISHLLNGKVELTQDVALRLESVLGLPAKFWNNLEAIYREQLERVHAELKMQQEIELAKMFPYAKMAALGWVAATKKAEEKVSNLRSFFEVARLDLLENLCIPGIAFRTGGVNEKSDYALAAWAQKARLTARNYEVSEINIEKLKEYVPAIRALMVKPADIFCGELARMLGECGIAIVFLPHIGGSFLHGATFVDGKHIVIGLTVRGKDADRFWFSLFHEIYHILAGHIFKVDVSTSQQEQEADAFARDTLINPQLYRGFLSCGNFSEYSICEFSHTIGVLPCIVLGRLQKENFVPYNRFHSLKLQYEIA